MRLNYGGTKVCGAVTHCGQGAVPSTGAQHKIMILVQVFFGAVTQTF